jgi:hypothetical protein
MFGLPILGKTFGILTNMNTAILLGGTKKSTVAERTISKKEVCFLCKPKNNDESNTTYKKPVVQRKLQKSV